MLKNQFSDFKSQNIRKYFIVLAIFLLITLFWDSLLLFLVHLLHVAFEFIASILEHGLQIAFNLTERQAQIMLFYIGLVMGSLFAWRISKKAYRKGKVVCSQAKCRAKQAVQEANWLKLLFVSTIIGSSLLAFT